jgi:biotin synthase
VLNHALLTVREAERRGLRVRAVVLNACARTPADVAARTNLAALRALLPGVPVLAFPFVPRRSATTGRASRRSARRWPTWWPTCSTRAAHALSAGRTAGAPPGHIPGRVARPPRRARPSLPPPRRMSASPSSWTALAERVLAGEPATRDDALAVLRAPDAELLDQLAAAYRVRRHHWGNRVRLHFLLNAQSGLCPEDCGYCSQSKVSAAEIDKYPMLARERILEAADRAAALKAGHVLHGDQRARARAARLREGARRGARGEGAARPEGVRLPRPAHRRAGVALKEAGVTQVNHNLNTSKRFTPEVVHTHTFEDRVATGRAGAGGGAQDVLGGIVGMGETDEDVVDLALSLRELEVRSVPVNFLIPVPGTPFEHVRALDPRQCLRILCAYRFLLPSQELRIAGGREVHLRSLQADGALRGELDLHRRLPDHAGRRGAPPTST